MINFFLLEERKKTKRNEIFSILIMESFLRNRFFASGIETKEQLLNDNTPKTNQQVEIKIEECYENIDRSILKMFDLSQNKGKKLYLGNKKNWIVTKNKLIISHDVTGTLPIESYLYVFVKNEKVDSIVFYMTNGHTFKIYYDLETNAFFYKGKMGGKVKFSTFEWA